MLPAALVASWTLHFEWTQPYTDFEFTTWEAENRKEENEEEVWNQVNMEHRAAAL